MLKEKTFVEGKNLEAVIHGEKIENFQVKGVQTKEELDNLIEELMALKEHGIETKKIPNNVESVISNVGDIAKEPKEKKTKGKTSGKKEKTVAKNGEKKKTKQVAQVNEELLKEILEEIENKYPNKEVPSAEFRESHLSLYNKATKATKESGTTLKDFLESNGFEYLRKKRGVKSENPN